MIKAYAVKKAKGELTSFEYDPGVLGNHDVEIDITHCGICHSDLSMIDNQWGITRYPLVPGHEVIGTVASIGENVRHIAVGDSVGLGWHSSYCMTCSSCLSGDHNLCSSAQATIVGHHGGFADKVRANAHSVVKLPDGMDKVAAGPLFCGGITVFNPLMQFGIKPTDRVGVIGIGGLGHMALQFLRAWGCEVTAFTSSENKKEGALALGAHRVLNSRDSSDIGKMSGKLDFILSTVNVKLDWNAYLSTLAPKGHFHVVGATLEPMDISAFLLLAGQRSISGSPVGSPANITKMLDFANRHQIKPVIETYSFDNINSAIARLRSRKAHYRIVLHHR